MYTQEIIYNLEFLLQREEALYLELLDVMEVLPHQTHIDGATAILSRIEALEAAIKILKEV